VRLAPRQVELREQLVEHLQWVHHLLVLELQERQQQQPARWSGA
jgi:hypothetical protein